MKSHYVLIYTDLLPNFKKSKKLSFVFRVSIIIMIDIISYYYSYLYRKTFFVELNVEK